MNHRTSLTISLLIISLFLVAVDSQYMSYLDFKPDITFGEHNDRFDISPLIRYQNQNYKDIISSAETGRRSNKAPKKQHGGKWIVLNSKGPQKTIDKIKKVVAKELEEIKNLMSGKWRRSEGVFLVDHEREDAKNFEMAVDDLGTRRSLSDVYIKLGGGRRMNSDRISKRNNNILLKYAVPIEMAVDGFLTLPSSVV